MFFIFSISAWEKNFPIEAHYKKLEELVPKHPPDGIIVHQHYHCSENIFQNELFMEEDVYPASTFRIPSEDLHIVATFHLEFSQPSESRCKAYSSYDITML